MKTFNIYNSVADLSAALASKKPFDCWPNPVSKRSEREMTSFAGITFKNACKMLSTGDADGAAKIKAQGEILAEQNDGNIPQIVSAVVGCIPSVPNYLRGVPNQMLKVVREPKQMPIIDIYVDSSLYGGCDVEKAARSSAKIANVITATEMAGVRVNLYAFSAFKAGNDCACMVVKIKDDDAPMNLLNIAFPLTNRAFERCIAFDWVEKHHDKYMEGYGRCMKEYEVRNQFNIEGLIFGVTDIMENNTSVEQLADKVNAYINRKRGE